MWRLCLCFLTIVFTVEAIKIAVDGNEENTTDIIPENKDADEIQVKPSSIYYNSDDAEVESYLIPSDPNKPQSNLVENLATPATYLVPPSADKQSNFYISPSGTGYSDWLPIANDQPIISTELQPPRYQQDIPIIVSNHNLSDSLESIRNTRVGRVYADKFAPPIPSEQLEPPQINAPNEYFLPMPPKYSEFSPAEQIQLHPQSTLLKYRKKVVAEKPILTLRLAPPRPGPPTLKYPTKLYPKKYNSGFKPLPIPIAQFAEGGHEIPRAKPMKLFNPMQNSDIDYISSINDKKIYQYQEAEQKRKLKNNADSYQPIVPGDENKENYGAKVPTTTEQETSETNHRSPGRNVYPVSLRQRTPTVAYGAKKDPQAPDDRTEFRMHGMKGPHSYQFGYDTGKGKNRQFRYEERDNDGQIKGHYGYMDKHGKLRIVNYSAHPEHGFHAETPAEKE